MAGRYHTALVDEQSPSSPQSMVPHYLLYVQYNPRSPVDTKVLCLYCSYLSVSMQRFARWPCWVLKAELVLHLPGDPQNSSIPVLKELNTHRSLHVFNYLKGFGRATCPWAESFSDGSALSNTIFLAMKI